jgi:dual specificity phosphatase 12
MEDLFDGYDAQRIGITNIWIGPVGAATDLIFLIQNNIKHVINLSGLNIFQYKFIRYYNIYIADHPSKDISVYFQNCHFIIDKATQKNENILINCYAGISRSATICLSWLMKELDINYLTALELLRICRPICRPNEGFIKQLKNYEILSHDMYMLKRGF